MAEEDKDRGVGKEPEPKREARPFVFVPADFVVRATGTFTPPPGDPAPGTGGSDRPASRG